MHFLHGRVQLREDLQALVGDKCFHDAAIFLFAGAGDQAAPFQAIEQARDVGIARDQPAADFAAGQAAAPAPRRIRRTLYWVPDKPAVLRRASGPRARASAVRQRARKTCSWRCGWGARRLGGDGRASGGLLADWRLAVRLLAVTSLNIVVTTTIVKRTEHRDGGTTGRNAAVLLRRATAEMHSQEWLCYWRRCEPV